MVDQGDQSKIEALKKGLYSRNAPDVRHKHHAGLEEDHYDVKTDWEHPQEPVEEVRLNEEYEDHHMSFFTKLLIASGIFFVLALGVGAYLFFQGSNMVSANNVDIMIEGPVSVSGGEPLGFQVQVYNKNNIKLELVDLTVEFPAGTADPDDSTKELRRFREFMDDINPGGVSQKTVRAILYGEENSRKQVKVRVEYRVKGSNAINYKEKDYEVAITSAPINISISSFKEVNSGQEFEMAVQVTSNSQEVLKNILLKAVYPFGYTFISSDVKPIYDNATWKIGDLPPKGKRTIKIKGRIDGQDDEERVIRFALGVQSIKSDKIIGTEFVTTAQNILVKKPFLSTEVAFDGDTTIQEYVSQFNNQVQVEISWFNNLPTSVIDGEIRVKLSGSAFDKASVSPDQGFYRSAENEIVWNKITSKSLASIGAGESGRVSFRITPRNLSTQARQVINPDIGIDVSVKANRVSDGSNVPQVIASTVKKKIKVGSSASLASQVLYSTGPLTNTGPFPPKAETPTTFTVLWTIYNTSSNISNAEVRSSLPAYVKWVDKVAPSNENIVYNPVDGSIIWKAGSIAANTGTDANKRQVAFQISLTPSVSQVGQSPVLINEAVFSAIDQFTNTQIETNLSGQTTELQDDSRYAGNGGAVQR
ncbi:MAG: hypothetical protein HZA80_01245 [Candidatus Taylorbacteria bacterium]|nr:hypothetical protein [Candidatus Taylorbacteria bacterium]